MANTLSSLLNKVYVAVGEAAKEYNEKDTATKLAKIKQLKGECDSTLTTEEKANVVQLNKDTSHILNVFKTTLQKGNKDEILDMLEFHFKLREIYHNEIRKRNSNANIVDRYIRGENVHDR